MTLNKIETNKINKKQSKMNLTHMICYTWIKVSNDYSYPNFDFIISF